MSVTLELKSTAIITKMNQNFIVLLAILQLTISNEIPSDFILEMLKKFNKKYVIWHLNQEQNTLPMIRNITNFGRLVKFYLVFNQNIERLPSNQEKKC